VPLETALKEKPAARKSSRFYVIKDRLAKLAKHSALAVAGLRLS
jgi:hypothetical protein